MEFQPSKRIGQIKSAIFTEMGQLKAKVESKGMEVIDLGVGSPDLPPSEHIINALRDAVANSDNYGYPMTHGSKVFRDEVAEWYRFRFGVELNSGDEVLSLMGSQDGLAHLAQAIIDPGDVVLVPDPGYPIYSAGVLIAGGELFAMPLQEENDFLPDFDLIPEGIARRAKLMILNYPSNPVSAVANVDFFLKAVDFARQHEIVIAHDLAYSEMAFDGFTPPSLLQVPGAKEVGVEFNSLSKSFNMAGCRVAYVVGNSRVIQALAVIKSNIDYGVFLPIQFAAVEALRQDRLAGGEHRTTVASVYERRRNVFVDRLNSIGWPVARPKATKFIWAKVPLGWTSMDFARMLLEETGVLVIPGSGFGSEGEGYVRMALVHDEAVLLEAADRIGKLSIFSE